MRLTVSEVNKMDDLKFQSPDSHLTKDDSVMKIFVDFNQIPPVIIEDSARAFQVREIMKREHINLKIVVDARDHFQGILPLTCLTEENLTRKMLSEDYDKDTLLVRHCMWKKSELHALDFNELKSATIGEVIDALQHIGHRHCLVIDHSAHQIRGVISASDISKALGMPIDISVTGVGTSFLEIFRGMHQLV